MRLRVNESLKLGTSGLNFHNKKKPKIIDCQPIRRRSHLMSFQFLQDIDFFSRSVLLSWKRNKIMKNIDGMKQFVNSKNPESLTETIFKKRPL